MAPMLAELLGLVAPPRCSLCAGSCLAREAVCDRCEARLRALRPRFVRAPGLDAAWSASAYEGLTRELVMALKFGARLQLAGRAAVAIADSAPADLLRGVIVPVPAAPARRRRRGFDAAEEIAAALAARTGLEARRCLRRAQGRRQVGRPRAERLADPPRVALHGAPPERAVLVDDVLTTGATVRACADALRCGGAERVVALTFAASGGEAHRDPPGSRIDLARSDRRRRILREAGTRGEG
jgi:ComF family protein